MPRSRQTRKGQKTASAGPRDGRKEDARFPAIYGETRPKISGVPSCFPLAGSDIAVPLGQGAQLGHLPFERFHFAGQRGQLLAESRGIFGLVDGRMRAAPADAPRRL